LKGKHQPFEKTNVDKGGRTEAKSTPLGGGKKFTGEMDGFGLPRVDALTLECKVHHSPQFELGEKKKSVLLRREVREKTGLCWEGKSSQRIGLLERRRYAISWCVENIGSVKSTP